MTQKETNPKICKELKTLLKYKAFFNCVGGCGFDTSKGKHPCMDMVGMWFKYCPFCGKKIISKKTVNGWIWFEDKLQLIISKKEDK
jgi:hypothetical protein